jgi:hypothetical protein
VHRGVYAVGHRRLRDGGWWLAAVLSCGSGALLSHWAAATLWDLRAPRGGAIDVTTAARSGRARQRGIRLHQVRTLPERERAAQDGIPVTSVARTLLDLTPALRPRAVEQLIAAAVRHHRFDLREVRATIAAHPTRAGSPALTALLDRLHADGTVETRSPFEVDLLQFCDDRGLPAPAANASVCGFLVDALWPDARIVVESDGYDFHAMPTTFEEDRRRDQVLLGAGYRVMRITRTQLRHEPERLAATLRTLLR